MNDYNLELDRGGNGAFLYSSAIGFLLLVPGSLLLMFGKEEFLLFPKPVIDLIFPVTVAPLEELFLTKITKKFKVLGEVTPVNFEHVDIFVQQFFVMSLLFSFAIILIFILQARARYLYPMPSNISYFGFVKAVLFLVLLREAQVCLLVETTPTNSRASTAPVTRLLLHAVAPEFLIMFTCGIAVVLWTAILRAYREIALSWT